MIHRRLIVLGACSLVAEAASSQPAPRQGPDPEPLVRGFYAPSFDEDRLPMSNALRRLREAAQARSDRDGEPVAGLDFSWILGAQDADEAFRRTLAFKTLAQTLGNAVVEVRFRNGGPQTIQYRVVKEGGRWVVDDIEYLTSRQKLSALFARGAKGG